MDSFYGERKRRLEKGRPLLAIPEARQNLRMMLLRRRPVKVRLELWKRGKEIE